MRSNYLKICAILLCALLLSACEKGNTSNTLNSSKDAATLLTQVKQHNSL